MIANLRKLIEATPFVPFAIHTADGGVLYVPTVDHIAVPPAGEPIFVFADDGNYEVLSPLLITRLAVARDAAASSQEV